MNYSRTILGFALAAVCASAGAQSITTLFASDNGGAQNGVVFFDVVAGPNDVIVSGWDWNIGEAAGTTFGISVWTLAGTTAQGSETSNAGWFFETGGSGLTAGDDNPSFITQDNDFTFLAGTTTGVMLVVGANASFEYTNGAGAAGGSYGNDPTGIYSNADMTINLGAAANSPWDGLGGGIFNPRIGNFTMYYTAIPEPGSMIALGIGLTALLARRRRKLAA